MRLVTTFVASGLPIMRVTGSHQAGSEQAGRVLCYLTVHWSERLGSLTRLDVTSTMLRSYK